MSFSENEKTQSDVKIQNLALQHTKEKEFRTNLYEKQTNVRDIMFQTACSKYNYFDLYNELTTEGELLDQIEENYHSVMSFWTEMNFTKFNKVFGLYQ